MSGLRSQANTRAVPAWTSWSKSKASDPSGGRYQEEEAAFFTAVLDGGMKTGDLHIRQSNFEDNALHGTVEFPAG